MRKLNILWGLMMLTMVAFGQSASTINFVSNIREGANVVHTQQLWIGEQADITIDGDWIIYSEQIYIHPNAKIHGNGRIVLKNPNGAIFPMGEKPTVLDGSYVNIDCDIVFENENNLLLMPLTYDGTDLGWQNDAHANYDLVVGKSLKLNVDDGHVVLGDGNVIVDKDAEIIDYSENRYFVTNSDGVLKKNGLKGEFIFPVGFEEGTDDNNDYTPAKLINNGLEDGFSVKVDHEVTDFVNSQEGVRREWTIKEDVDGGSYVELDLQHNKETEGTKYSASSEQFVTQYAGEAPNTLGGDISSTTWDYSRVECSQETGEGTLTEGYTMTDASELTRIGFTDFYNHTKFTKAVCEKSVLDNIWKIFTADVQDCETQVSWVVETKYLNADYFVVERSYDGILFLPITTVDASTENEFYKYFDPIAPNGKVYYRVKVVDQEGDYEYSPIDMIESECGMEVAVVYPNPFFDDVTIVMNTTGGVDALIVYNEIGQRMDVPIEFDGNLIKIDARKLSAANYYALVINGDKFYTIELTKILDKR